MRIEQISFTRFIAAISIVIYHYAIQLFPENQTFIINVFNHANVGVSYFYILSGFVMIVAYGNYEKIDAKTFYINRFARIYPIYLISLILISIVYLFSNQFNDLLGFVLNFFVIQAWVPGNAIKFHGQSWSITVEFFFYVIFPYLFTKIYKQYNYKKIFFIVLIIWMGSQLVFNILINTSFYTELPSKSHDFLFYFPLMHLNEFLVGNFLGIYFLKNKHIRNYDLIIVILFLILITILNYPLGLNYHNGLLAVVFAPLIYFISLNNGMITKAFNNKHLIHLGEISYGIYILQYPVFLWTSSFNKHFHLITNKTFSFLFGFTILIISASLSYRYFEVPIRNKIKYLFK